MPSFGQESGDEPLSPSGRGAVLPASDAGAGAGADDVGAVQEPSASAASAPVPVDDGAPGPGDPATEGSAVGRGLRGVRVDGHKGAGVLGIARRGARWSCAVIVAVMCFGMPLVLSSVSGPPF
jgi:hypothetical protein